MKLLLKPLKSDKFWLFYIIFLFVLLYSFIGISKHNHFQTFGWDTAIFDQQAYLISQLKLPYSSLHGFIGLGDHFHPLFYLLAGFGYKVWSDARMLYILQPLIGCLSTWPLYLICQIVLAKLKFKKVQINFLSLVICFSYLFSVSFQFLVVGEYNDAVNFTLPFLLLIYFLLKNNELGYWLSFAAMLLSKEEYSLVAIPLSLYICLTTKNLKKSVLTLAIGITYFYLVVFQVMPKISHTNEYIFFSNQNRPTNLSQEMLSHPQYLVTKLVDNSEKQKTLLVSFLSFGFLPLLAPIQLIVPVFDLMIRFYDDSLPRRFEFNNQYAAGLIAPLVVAQVFGALKLGQILIKLKYKLTPIFYMLMIYLLTFTLLQNIIFHGPINSLLKKQFYATASWEVDTNQLIAQVPAGVSIAANNSLLPHLSERENFYLLPNYSEAEYIAVDLSEGPNKFAPLQNSSEIKKLIDQLVVEKKYQIIWQKNQAVLLKRI